MNKRLGNLKILIDSRKTIDELIEFYFKKIGKSNLYKDESILFSTGDNIIISPYTLLSKVNNLKTIRIAVNSNNDKMK